MSDKNFAILEQIKSLNCLETAQLVKQIEATFGVDASARQVIIKLDKDEPKPPEPAQTEFDVILEAVPADKKIATLKMVRTLTGLGLKEAKDFVESTPQVVQSAIALDIAKEIKQNLESVGAKVWIK